MGYVNMKFAILLSLVACTLGAPSLPRLPLRVLLNGDAPLEGSSVGIVGGQFMLPFELPFLVSVQFESFSGFSHGCGGSVYNKDFIVDAAHCFPEWILPKFALLLRIFTELEQRSRADQIRQENQH